MIYEGKITEVLLKLDGLHYPYTRPPHCNFLGDSNKMCTGKTLYVKKSNSYKDGFILVCEGHLKRAEGIYKDIE